MSNDLEPIHQFVGERVKAIRRQRNWTLDQLASLSGVSRSMLSQIERGSANPTLGVAYRIAQAFGMSLGDLADVPEARPKLDVIRADEEKHWFRNDEDIRIRTLSPLHLEKDVEFYEVRIQPGASLVSAAHFDGTREFLTVEKGAIHLSSDDESTELRRGDSAHYRADVPHAIKNIGRGVAVCFLVNIYQRSHH